MLYDVMFCLSFPFFSVLLSLFPSLTLPSLSPSLLYYYHLRLRPAPLLLLSLSLLLLYLHPLQLTLLLVLLVYHQSSPHHLRLIACTPTITANPNSTSPNVTMTFYL
jgi:hypothetical protein